MSVIDLSDVITDLATGPVTVTRTTPNAQPFGTDGRFAPGTVSTFVITAAIQPIKGRALLRLPEGQRTSELLSVFSNTRLFTQGAGQQCDTFSYNNATYQIELADEKGPNGNYWHHVARKIGRAAP